MQNRNFITSVAPMMDWTDRHCRWFHRQLSTRVLLYTEMVVADAVIHGDRDYLIGYNSAEHPVALQIGGSAPDKLAQAAQIGQDYGYDEININIGCPSDRVQSGRFGACLMQEPELVAECYAAMANAVSIPVTVKCRLGVDDQNIDETLPAFIENVSQAGCSHFIIHARKAWLQGLSPKENRDIPPLKYGKVREMKARFPHLEIVLNGGLPSTSYGFDQCQVSNGSQSVLDGFMLGRAAYHTPWILTDIDHKVYGTEPFPHTRDNIAERLIEYASQQQSHDKSTKALIRHIMGLYAGLPGARLWRRTLSENSAKKTPPADVIAAALETRQSFPDAA